MSWHGPTYTLAGTVALALALASTFDRFWRHSEFTEAQWLWHLPRMHSLMFALCVIAVVAYVLKPRPVPFIKKELSNKLHDGYKATEDEWSIED